MFWTLIVIWDLSHFRPITLVMLLPKTYTADCSAGWWTESMKASRYVSLYFHWIFVVCWKITVTVIQFLHLYEQKRTIVNSVAKYKVQLTSHFQTKLLSVDQRIKFVMQNMCGEIFHPDMKFRLHEFGLWLDLPVNILPKTTVIKAWIILCGNYSRHA